MEADNDAYADIDTIARGLGVTEWDVALIGDGAGRGWDRPAGWSCILIDRHVQVAGIGSDARKLFSGGMNLSTVEIAELMPYIQGMLWYERYHGRTRRTQLGKACLDVLVITDRTSTAQFGSAMQEGRDRVAEVCRKHPLWATILQFERLGYRFAWFHRHRGRVALNTLADHMADVAKHAAASALALGSARLQALHGPATDEQLIYMFNSAAFDGGDISLMRRAK